MGGLKIDQIAGSVRGVAPAAIQALVRRTKDRGQREPPCVLPATAATIHPYTMHHVVQAPWALRPTSPVERYWNNWYTRGASCPFVTSYSWAWVSVGRRHGCPEERLSSGSCKDALFNKCGRDSWDTGGVWPAWALISCMLLHVSWPYTYQPVAYMPG